MLRGYITSSRERQPALTSDQCLYYAPEELKGVPFPKYLALIAGGCIGLLVVALLPTAPAQVQLFAPAMTTSTSRPVISRTQLRAGEVVQIYPPAAPGAAVTQIYPPPPPGAPVTQIYPPQAPQAALPPSDVATIDPQTPITAMDPTVQSQAVLQQYDFSGTSTLSNSDVDMAAMTPGIVVAVLIIIGLGYYLYTVAAKSGLASKIGVEMNPRTTSRKREDFTNNYRPQRSMDPQEWQVGSQLEEEIRRRGLDKK